MERNNSLVYTPPFQWHLLRLGTLYLLFASITLASTTIDSLEAELANAQSGILRVDILNQLAFECLGSASDSALDFTMQSLDLSRALQYDFGEAIALSHSAKINQRLGQFAQADSIFDMALKLLDQVENPLETANVLVNKGRGLAELPNLKLAIATSKKALKLYDELNIDFLSSNTANEIGYRFWRIGVYDSALVYYNKSLTLREQLPNKRNIAKTINNIGVIYYQLGDYNKALDYYFKSLTIQQSIQNQYGISLMLSNIGKAFKDWGRYKEALFHFREALTLGESIGDNKAIAYSLNNIGSIYMEMGTLDSALISYENSLDKYTHENDIDGIILNLNSIGGCYMSMGNYSKALHYLNRAYEMANKIGHRFEMVIALKSMGQVYRNIGNNELALKQLQTSKNICINIGKLDLLKDIYLIISETYTDINDYKAALEYFQLYTELKDQLYGKQVENNIDKLKIRYETAEKEAENIVLRQKEQQQEAIIDNNRFILLMVSIALFMLVIIAATLYYITRSRAKANRLLNQSKEKYRRLSEQLAESDSIRELLLDIITHDLKNPAGVILGLSEMAREEFPENELIESIYTSSDRLLSVLADTTILSQAAFGENIPKESLDLNKLLVAIGDDFSSALHTADMTLSIEVPEEIIIKANPLIGEVFKNYISNAIKYANDGKRIVVNAVFEPESIMVRVIDYGKTIDESNRLHIFERRTQLDSEKKMGRGLGLAIVKRIATAHDGEVWVEPNKPQGNSFYLRIPH